MGRIVRSGSGYGVPMTEFWRGLVLIAAGAILHFAVTFHAPDIDVQTAGLVLLSVGLLDLAISVAFLSYERGWWDARRQPRLEESDAYDLPAAPYTHRAGSSEAEATRQLPSLRDRG